MFWKNLKENNKNILKDNFIQNVVIIIGKFSKYFHGKKLNKIFLNIEIFEKIIRNLAQITTERFWNTFCENLFKKKKNRDNIRKFKKIQKQ